VFVANDLGRRNGTSAPYFFAIEAISGSSVETTIWLKRLDFMEDSIVYAIRGLPANCRIFFRGTPCEPPLAPMKQSGFKKNSPLIINFNQSIFFYT